VEGRVRCTRCHSETPHGIAGSLSRHLDAHVATLACETCHIPTIARVAPTRTFVDYEKAASLPLPEERGPLGRPLYGPEKGVEIWERDLVPTYAWYDGTREAQLVGEPVELPGPVALNRPHGDHHDPSARITPFKIHRARQPMDAETQVLLLAKLWKGRWDGLAWEEALRLGMEAAGLDSSGELAYVETELYTGIHHEVVPSGMALSCADCHARDAVSCARCHERVDAAGIAGAAGAARHPDLAPRLDFRALGYEGDPARVGGRRHDTLGLGRPVR
jgi:hypothetical protein